MRTNSTKSIKAATKEAFLKQGAALMQANHFDQANIYFGEALKQYPSDAQLHYCKGVAHHQNKQLLEAASSYSQALLLNPKLFEAFDNLAEAQTELQFFNDALISIRHAIALNSSRPLSHVRLARILIRLGEYHEAIDACNYALTLDPFNSIAFKIRSDAHRGLNQLEAGIKDLRQAIALDPNNPDYVYNLSFDLLLNGDFSEGWACYESRFQTANFLNNVPKMVSPRWNGQDNLNGKTILICPEQGLGDQIQFGRYALVLLGMGAKVVMPVEPELIDIMQSLHPDLFVTSSRQPASVLPQHDYHIQLMSLPVIFNTTLENVPVSDKYLIPNATTAAKWAARFTNKKKLQIGITWSGSSIHVNDHNRSMSLKHLEPLTNLDVDWHILQTEIRPTDEVWLSQTPFKDWRHELISLNETAGLLEQLDLLVTVDTSVAHLSAALGKPTWIMLPFAPDFRWSLNRSDSPWYSSVHLVRQPQPGDWESVIANIYSALSG
jgi:tetratricopeptide (TPR) repeat protein